MNSHADDLNREQQGPANEVAQAERNPAPPESVLMTLREQLQELRQRFEATDAQIAGYLRDNAAPSGSGTNGEAIAHIQARLDQVLAKFDQWTTQAPASDGKPAAATGNQEVLDALKKMADFQNHLAGKIVNAVAKRITEELDLLRIQQVMYETLTTEWDRREALAEAKAGEAKAAEPPVEEDITLSDFEEDIPLQDVELEEEAISPESMTADEAWWRAIWGADLVESEAFAPFLDELNRRFLDGDPGIATLAGQLLVFRQAPSEAKPQLLKDVGEAYYRTRIDRALPDHPFERALIDWLQKDCEKAGLPNTIEVVHVGERFDKSRHSSTTRGAEVSEVFGWIVLTEGGRVYTRASVAAQ